MLPLSPRWVLRRVRPRELCSMLLGAAQMDSSTAPCDNDLRAPVTEMARTRRPGSPSRAATLPRPPSRRPHRPPLPLQPPALPFAAMGAASPAADGRVQNNAQNATSEVGYLANSASPRDAPGGAGGDSHSPSAFGASRARPPAAARPCLAAAYYNDKFSRLGHQMSRPWSRLPNPPN